MPERIPAVKFTENKEIRMYLKTWVGKILAVLALAVALAGCGTAPTTSVPTSTAVPTIDPKPTYDAVSTQAAQTVIANLTLNAPTATPVVPSDTPAPTSTPAPTDTPAPTVTSTRVFIPWTHTPTPTQPAYGCTVTSVSPEPGATKKVDEEFDGKWTVKNNGTETWNSGNVDIRFVDGTHFQTGADAFDLEHDVAPDGTYTFTVDMKAPSNDGSYSASWGIYLEDGSVCSLNLRINVTN
jgi:hypothetical protein